MIQSVCILGRQPALGLAELESLYGAGTVGRIAPQAAGTVLDSSAIDFVRLGGSTRLASVLATIPTTNWKLVEKELAKIARSYTPASEGKITLGLSTFGFDMTTAKLTATGLTLKKILRSTDHSVRLVPNPELELNTAQVLHNHLTEQNGLELLCIATSDNRTVIAQTVAVQDIDSYTLRDRGRPKRDARVGMLPPKLAQIIINLAVGQLPTETLHSTPEQRLGATMPHLILDPFCGTGVVLQEALLMGYDVYGYDLEPRMIAYSKANLDWLNERFGVAHGGEWDFDYTLNVGDATTTKFESKHTVPIDRVACETYLGRPYTTLPDHQTLEQNVSDVNTIITKFLRNIHGQLPAGARLCIAVPAWHLRQGRTLTQPASGSVLDAKSTKSGFRHLPLIDQIENLGYNQVRFEHVRSSELLYYREDQIVARELLVLQVN